MGPWARPSLPPGLLHAFVKQLLCARGCWGQLGAGRPHLPAELWCLRGVTNDPRDEGKPGLTRLGAGSGGGGGGGVRWLGGGLGGAAGSPSGTLQQGTELGVQGGPGYLAQVLDGAGEGV